jgi:hypothetical protein
MIDWSTPPPTSWPREDIEAEVIDLRSVRAD